MRRDGARGPAPAFCLLSDTDERVTRLSVMMAQHNGTQKKGSLLGAPAGLGGCVFLCQTTPEMRQSQSVDALAHPNAVV